VISNDLVEFMKYIKKDGEGYIYSDEYGNRIPMQKFDLIPSVVYQKCKEEEYKQLLFKGMIKADDKFNEIEDKTQVTKDTITGKEEDKNTIVDKTIKVKEMWLVSNKMRISKIFNNKQEALELYDEINEVIK
jgi:hypothetical protein